MSDNILYNAIESFSHSELLDLAEDDCVSKGSLIVSKESLNLIMNHILNRNDDSLTAILVADKYQEQFEELLFDQYYLKTIFTSLLNDKVFNLFIITEKQNQFISYKYEIK